MSLISMTAWTAGQAVAEDAVKVDLDLTVLGQMALFIVLMLVLKPLLFDPMLRLFEEREKRIEGAKLEARKMDAESAEAVAKYEAAMAKVRAEANAERDRLRAAALRAESEILSKARAAVASTLDSGRQTMAVHRKTLKEELTREGADLALQVAAKTLGREVRG